MKPQKLPHIVIFNPDQFRSDAMGFMGNPAALTPNFDRFVDTEGVGFRNAFCQNPVCTPSRCSFMSGWYPHVRGHRIMHYMMQPDEPVLLKTLKDAGYYVWWGGKNDLIPGKTSLDAYCNHKNKPEHPLAPNLHQWQDWRGDPEGDNYYSFFAGKLEWDGEGTYRDRDWAHIQDAVKLIRNPPPDQPFCLYLPLGYPHPPYGVEDPWFSAIDRQKLPDRVPCPDDSKKPSTLARIRENQNLQGWTEDRWKELRATYLGMCSRVDAQFGLLMDALREAGMYDDTAVFVFSDHGDYTGDYGLVEKTQNTFEDCLTKVPFLVKPPSWLPVKPGIRDALVELVDFPATVEAITGIQPTHTHFGRSLLPVVAGETDIHREAVFCEGGRLIQEDHCREAQSFYKYDNPKQNLYWPRQAAQNSDGVEHGKAIMVRTSHYKYVRRLYESDELYDLNADPMELDNKICDPQYREVLLDMKERLMNFYLETCDVVPWQTDER